MHCGKTDAADTFSKLLKTSLTDAIYYFKLKANSSITSRPLKRSLKESIDHHTKIKKTKEMAEVEVNASVRLQLV